MARALQREAQPGHPRLKETGTVTGFLETRIVTPLLIGLSLATAAAFAARLVGLLTTGGALAAVGIGTAVFAGGGWGLALTLVGAFALTGAATRYRRAEKTQPEHRRGRSAIQVLANGLIPAGLAAIGGVIDLPWALVGAAGAISASTADTLATEVGLLSRTPPRMITTGQMVARGRSGGITLTGTAAGVAGAGVVGGFALGLLPLPGPGAASVVAGGIAALFVDSVLGATVQARYKCPTCGEEGETRECTCGATRVFAGGIPWMTNDAVNLLMAAVGAAIAVVLSR